MAYVQYGHLSDAERAADEQRRRFADAIKEIEQLHAMQIGALSTWLRHRDYPQTGVAQQALEQLGNARRQENLVLRNVLGIFPGPAVTGPKAQNRY